MTDEELIEAMKDAHDYAGRRTPLATLHGMRAALAVARLSMGEVERDAERYRWLRARGVVTRAAKESIVETQGGALLDAAIDAARAKEAP